MVTTNMSKTGIIAEFLGISLVLGFTISIIPVIVLSGGVLLVTGSMSMASWTAAIVMVIVMAIVLFCLYAAADYMAWEHARYYN